jgi:hypothetical protein
MVDITVVQKIAEMFGDICNDIQAANNLVTDGREVKCHQKMQGVITKSGNLIRYLQYILQQEAEKGNDGEQLVEKNTEGE